MKTMLIPKKVCIIFLFILVVVFTNSADPGKSTGSPFEIVYKITDLPSNNFRADVAVVNHGPFPVEGWTLTWSFPEDQRIRTLWKGRWKQTEYRVKVKNTSWNKIIPAKGGKVYFSFYVSYGQSNAGPVDFALNDVLCRRDAYTVKVFERPAYGAPVGVKHNVFFHYDDGLHGRELWKSNGTSRGTMLVKDIRPGPASALKPTRPMARFRDFLVFPANDGEHEMEPWISDGTESGTTLLKDIYPGNVYSLPMNFKQWDRGLFFAAWDPACGQELWTSDGTAQGTRLLKNIFDDTNVFDGSWPGSFAGLNDKIYFQAADETHGRELWQSDGTPEGTKLFLDLMPGPESTFSFFPMVPLFPEMPAANGFFFFVPDTDNGLWASDGTTEGTRRIKAGESPCPPQDLTAAGDKLFFTAHDSNQEHALWVTDGTEAGTRLVFKNDRETLLTCLTRVGDDLFFRYERFGQPDHCSLWVSDGSLEGTRMVKDFSMSPARPSSLTDGGGILFFMADDGLHGKELWRSDGSRTGTFMVQDLTPGPGDTGVYEMFFSQGRLWFFGRMNLGENYYLWALVP